MQYRVYIATADGGQEQLDCQTFKGYAYRRASEFQLGYVTDAKVKRDATRHAKGSTNEEAFKALQTYLDSVHYACTRVCVEPYQREKTPEELEKERQAAAKRKMTTMMTRSRFAYDASTASSSSSDEEDDASSARSRRSARSRKRLYRHELKPVKIRRAPVFIPFSELKPTARLKWYPRF